MTFIFTRSLKFTLIFFLPFSIAFSDVLLYQKAAANTYDEVVSLGARCEVAHQIENYGIRHRAYPFDWIVTGAEGLAAFITNEGSHFLDKDKVQYHGIYPGSPPYQIVTDTHYGFQSFHDFLGPEVPGNFEAVKGKFYRRVRRFFELLRSNKRVLFIRTSVTRKEAEHLDNIIHTLYPRLNYTFVALNNSEDFKTSWNHPRIKNYYISITPSNWQGDYKRWGEILSEFHVKKTPKSRPSEERW